MPTNALAHEKSPYLQQHADNPVDWLPWGAEAFHRARSQDKPIFLSIGYSTCHWCHVMAHESFEDEGIAQILNKHYISIKVDREERPDVDRVFMAFVQAMTGSGGWPLSAWLTPDLKPFYGGTYFPPQSRHGRAGFADVLLRVAELWEKEKSKVLEQGEKMFEALAHRSESHADTPVVPGLSVELVEQCRQYFDHEYGGLGRAPKFPQPSLLRFLMDQKTGRDMALLTLRRMASGGIYDQLGGGFHRYSVDRFWHVPHFEKMLYDQAQLIPLYIDAWQSERDERFATVARETLEYVLRDLAHPSGAFYSAEDADSFVEHGSDEHAEGAFYVWTAHEVMSILGPREGEAFMEAFGMQATGNAPEGSDPMSEFIGKNILTGSGADSRWDAARQALLHARNARPRPHLDRKILSGWNGLMLSALASAAGAWGKQYATKAHALVGFLKNEMIDRDGRMLRSWMDGPSQVAAFAEDYAFVIQGLLDLYHADPVIGLVEIACDLQRVMDEEFADALGGYFNTSAGASDLLLRLKDDHDGAEPSANAVAALNLQRLAVLTDDKQYQARADALLRAYGEHLRETPMAMPLMLLAAQRQDKDRPQIVLAGRGAEREAMLAAVHSHRPPLAVVMDAASARKFSAAEFLKAIPISEDRCEVYLCSEGTCRLPIREVAELHVQLKALEAPVGSVD